MGRALSRHRRIHGIEDLAETVCRRAVREFVDHYHHERNHQGLGNRLILPPATPGGPHGPIQCRDRLGGLLKYYYRQAA